MENNSFQDVINHLRNISASESEKGHRFELLMKRYFEIDPIYTDKFEEVWLWSEFPLNGGKHDTGIDLVAKEKTTGKYCAIQCKFYNEEYSIQKNDIDSFFTESGKNIYDSRIIVSSTDKWSKNAEESLKDQSKEITRIRLQDLEKSQIDWSSLIGNNLDNIKLKKKHTLRPHQQEAHDNVLEGFKNADRGKLIMACGTGKTFTSLKITETIVKNNNNKSVILYLVPSISLLSQTLREWNNQTTTPFHTFAVCSDSKVSKSSEDITSIDIGFPATTNINRIIKNYNTISDRNEMIVVFSTYQSIDVIHEAQEKGFPTFDLIISDEAHRTTGVTLVDEEESHFVKVHNNDYIRGYKRLYQTATPKVFGERTKNKADEKDAILASMDNKELFGEEFHNLGFGEAVERGLLTDYKVMILVTDQKYVDFTLADQIKSENNTLHPKDFSRIVGTWNGLSKRKTHSNEVDGKPMRRAVAFTSTIEKSKQITNMFQSVVDDYMNNSEVKTGVNIEIEHVDGTMNNLVRSNRLDWLEEETGDENTCRILSNARCLTEGVDVPDLDSVIFFNPRNSVIDIIQAVGRVMRRADGKDYGYIILPITIDQGADLEYELNNNQEYRVVWQVLQALRSHDERFNAMINQMELNTNKPSTIEIIGHTGEIHEDGGEYKTEGSTNQGEKTEQIVFNFPDLEELQDSIYARIVDKVGDKEYWESWSNDVAEIAQRHYDRISLLLRDKNSEEYRAFHKFLSDLKNNLNDSIEEDQAIEMLSQHLITKPVFEALFEEHSFVKNNPVSRAMEEMLKLLEKENLEKETQSLNRFYESVKIRASKIDNLEGKQKVIIELYDRFFGTAFKKTTERLGIVYTPVEIVDFIIYSVNNALKKEFGVTLNDKGVNILDPFTGTGTFVVRLLQSGLIDKDKLLYKYTNEIHANEIILLAYYIASINIEETFHSLAVNENVIGNNEYKPFQGIVLTDTFQMTEEKDTFISEMFGDNSERVNKQNQVPLKVIIGNPPYSARQRDANDNNANINYKDLDSRIRETYVKESTSKTVKDLYDPYTRAIRWSSDRVEGNGIVAFITNGSFIETNTFDGFRKSLTKEFDKIYVLNLRGFLRGKSRKDAIKEGENVFDIQTGVAILILIKNEESKKDKCSLYYFDIGDALTKVDKLKTLESYKDIDNVAWQRIDYNAEGDWINQRDPNYVNYIPIGDKSKGATDRIFDKYSLGLNTNRDFWVYNFSRNKVLENMQNTINFYNTQIEKYQTNITTNGSNSIRIEDVVDADKTKISWSSSLYQHASRGRKVEFNNEALIIANYRPFSKRWLYYDRIMNHRPAQWDQIVPENKTNLVITISGRGSRKSFAALMTNGITDVNSLSPTQCFPLYFYEENNESNLFSQSATNQYLKVDTITDKTLKKFREKYSDDRITKKDIFFYVYGVLHSPNYREKYAVELRKMLARIPLVKYFWEFSKAGEELADLHINYEKASTYQVEEKVINPKAKDLYKVDSMKFKNKKDKSKILYNDNISLSGIPLKAYEYIVSGNSAIEWIMDQYQVKVDKDSGIVNDPNEYSDDPRYILDLLKKIITVSLGTIEIVESLPELEILDE